MPKHNKPLKDWENFETEIAFIILHKMDTTHDMEYLLEFIKKYFKKTISQTKTKMLEQILGMKKKTEVKGIPIDGHYEIVKINGYNKAIDDVIKLLEK